MLIRPHVFSCGCESRLWTNLLQGLPCALGCDRALIRQVGFGFCWCFLISLDGDRFYVDIVGLTAQAEDICTTLSNTELAGFQFLAGIFFLCHSWPHMHGKIRLQLYWADVWIFFRFLLKQNQENHLRPQPYTEFSASIPLLRLVCQLW